MAAKKTAKKAAKTAAKKTAKKAASATSPVKKAAAKAPARPPLDAVARAAYLNYRRRVEQGLPGNSDSDWLQAERQLIEGGGES